MTPDFARWPQRRNLRVETGDIEREGEPVVVPLDLPGADPGSVRVVECDEDGSLRSPVPAQFDLAEAGPGELCFLLAGRTPAAASRRFALLWTDAPAAGEPSAFLAPAQTLWGSPSASIKAETYNVRLDNGMLADLATKAGKPFISKVVLSSKETGWSHEPGTVERFDVLHAGPVRVVILVRKAPGVRSGS